MTLEMKYREKYKEGLEDGRKEKYRLVSSMMDDQILNKENLSLYLNQEEIENFWKWKEHN